jgi:hypothetical protein
VDQSNLVASNARVDPIGVDLAQHDHSYSQNSLPNHSAIMSPIIATQTNEIMPTTTNHNASNIFTMLGPSTISAPFISQSKPVPQLKPADNLIFPHSMPAVKDKTAFSTIQSQIMNNPFHPINITKPETESHKSQSFTNQFLPFNSPPLLTAPQQNKQPAIRSSRANKGKSTRPANKTNSDPKINQLRPEKKPETQDIQPDSTTNLLAQSAPPENQFDLDAQGEKKRRREEETNVKPDHSDESVYFLTAGPGSQACRDQ